MTVIDRSKRFKAQKELFPEGPEMHHFYGTARCLACNVEATYLVPVLPWMAHAPAIECEACGALQAFFIREADLREGQLAMVRIEGAT